MSSILTNTSSMVALQTLRSINSDLATTQAQISTGKSVATAKDNSAVWAISKVMESDVNGFMAISDSLSLGQSTIAVARDASETVTDLLTDIKGKIVAAQEENVDREKIQTDIQTLSDQIKSVVGAAQFNGLNLLKGTDDMNILSSLDRSGDGTVAASNITVARQNLEETAGVFGADGALSNISGSGTLSADANTEAVTIGGTIADGETFSITLAGQTLTYTATGGDAANDVVNGLMGLVNTAGIEGVTAANATGGVLDIDSTNAFTEFTVTTATTSASGTIAAADGTLEARAEVVTLGAGNVAEGDSYRITIDSQNYEYVAGKNENMNDVAAGLKKAIDAAGVEGLNVKVNPGDNPAVDGATLQIDNSGADVTFSVADNTGGTATGGLFGLSSIDVTSADAADKALDTIESLIQTAIDGAAAFGSAQSRVETQSEFISKLTDSLKAGIGALVDADMEEASARLQALQVQQQLGIQSLSIANQAPQSILSLFR